MKHEHDLRRLDNRPFRPATHEIRAFIVVRNEAARLPAFLAHHRGLGVDRFVFVDNGSTDGTVDLLLAQPDAHVFTTTRAYQEARNGIDWLELLLHTYGAGGWCLVLDADEHFVHP